MKRLIYICILLLSAQQILGQAVSEKPAAASPSAEKLLREEFNNEALKAETDLKTNAANTDAWLKLYIARRYENYTEHSREISQFSQSQLDEIVKQIGVNAPNSFAFNYASYLNLNKTNASLAYLNAAYNIDSKNAELWDDMLFKAAIQHDSKSVESFAQLLYSANIYSHSELEYNKNVLNSIEQNGVLFTYGNVDTYPLYMLQNIQKVRTDITIICIDWLKNESFLQECNKRLGLQSNASNFLSNALSNSSNKPFYLALTIPPAILKEHSKQLFCTGLAMRYSAQPVDHLSSLTFNWENLFSKQTLTSNSDINRNYLLPLVLLQKRYKSSGEKEKEVAVTQLAKTLAQQNGASKLIDKKLR